MDKIPSRKKAKEFIEDFEYNLGMAELKGLSKASLKKPLNSKQFKRMMELKREILGE